MAGDRSYAGFGAKVTDLEIAWRDRLADSESLMEASRFSTAVCHGLYALEILLKVRICLRLELDQLPKPFEIHDLEGLLVLAGLYKRLAADENLPVKANWDQIKVMAFRLNEFRYGPNDAVTEGVAKQFFEQLEKSEKGVIPWILNPT